MRAGLWRLMSCTLLPAFPSLLCVPPSVGPPPLCHALSSTRRTGTRAQGVHAAGPDSHGGRRAGTGHGPGADSGGHLHHRGGPGGQCVCCGAGHHAGVGADGLAAVRAGLGTGVGRLCASTPGAGEGGREWELRGRREGGRIAWSAVLGRRARVLPASPARLPACSSGPKTRRPLRKRRILGSEPVDYLITPRILACMIATPVLNVLCFLMGAMAGGEGPACGAMEPIAWPSRLDPSRGTPSHPPPT